MKKIYIILIAIALILVTVFFHQRKENRENVEMQRFVNIIADETDEDFEIVTPSIIDAIKADSLFNVWIENNDIPYDYKVMKYFNEKYFNNTDIYHFYKRTLTICDSTTTFSQPNSDISVDCFEHFDNLLNSHKIMKISDNLYHIDDATSDIYYIAKIDLPDNQTLFIEFYKEKIFNKLQFDNESSDTINLVIPNLKNYSFGIYIDDILHYKLGNYYYPNNLNNFISKDEGIHKGNRFKHFILNDLDNKKSIVVSIESERWMRYVAPLSFIFFAILLTYFLYAYFEKSRSGNIKRSFHSKMQLSLLLTLAISFIVIGITSYIFLKNNITKKTQIQQYKQTNIIRNNLSTDKSSDNSIYNPMALIRLNQAFLTDIKIYDLDGYLVNGIVDNYIVIGDSIDMTAYESIYNDGAGYFVQTEYLKGEKCISYYFPILDQNNEIAAILNIPYFDTDLEYDDNLSEFALNYINIIIVLLGIASIIVLLITRKTLKPLKIIEEQMGKISLDGTNEPIDFKGRDEIGALVEQYNKMCRELEIAANQIVRNERESTWREMARQVAHEIKNPLTPMRLNIEYLQMLWDRKDPKFDENLKATLNSLLEQIETLTKIATAFSNYAKLPENIPSDFNLVELLKSTIKTYDVFENITISLIYNEDCDWEIYADKNNLSRIFGNIIKNATQAIGNKTGHIEVIVEKLFEKFRIQISDDGCGIKDEDKAKIFFPNFTTKSSGMGVGLSVSQDIIQCMGGNITFTSEFGKGTIFTIEIPILKNM